MEMFPNKFWHILNLNNIFENSMENKYFQHFSMHFWDKDWENWETVFLGHNWRNASCFEA